MLGLDLGDRMIYTAEPISTAKMPYTTRRKPRLGQERMPRQYPIISWELIAPWSRESWNKEKALELFGHPQVLHLVNEVSIHSKGTRAGKQYMVEELASVLVDYFIVHKLLRQGPRMGPEKRANPGVPFPAEGDDKYTPDDACRWLFRVMKNTLRDALQKQRTGTHSGASYDDGRAASRATAYAGLVEGYDESPNKSETDHTHRTIGPYRARCKAVAEELLVDSLTHKNAALYLLFEFAELAQGILSRVEYEAAHSPHGSKGLGLGRPAKDVGPAIRQWLEEYQEPWVDGLGEPDGTFRVDRTTKEALEKLDWILESHGESFEEWMASEFKTLRGTFNKRVRRAINAVEQFVNTEMDALLPSERKPIQTNDGTIVRKNGRIRRVFRPEIAKKGNKS